ncbi:MAG: hypothetical protein CTR55_03010 [Pseudomonas sp.]|uniref:hypothetical protein n=1 Tax=Pseudomonas sp. TaxID=306 RepID=UPI000CC73F1A|nr:hypothetical protein [Pseudomonas sp.]PJI50754.1 MAG: hypothetical protein CTR55_03010 [Pseudomonas sp.]
MSNILIHPGQFPLHQVTYQVTQHDGGPYAFVQYRVTPPRTQGLRGGADQHGMTRAIPTRHPDELSITLPNSVDEEDQ